jgi:protein-tyrosine-phosphatase
MAEALLRAALPRDSAWRVASAGTSAMPGFPASEYAQVVLAERGLNLKAHRSQPVTQELVAASTVVVAMTQAHVDRILRQVPDVRDRLYVMSAFDPAMPKGADVMDPFCGSLADYRACRDTLERALPGLLTFLRME